MHRPKVSVKERISNYADMAGYKRDAATLIVNRISKKFREYFITLSDFSAFQEVYLLSYLFRKFK